MRKFVTLAVVQAAGETMMRVLIAAIASVLASSFATAQSATAQSATAQTATAQNVSDKAVTRLDPALDALVSPDAKVELVKGGFGFTEGPVWKQQGKDGYLLFTDIP